MVMHCRLVPGRRLVPRRVLCARNVGVDTNEELIRAGLPVKLSLALDSRPQSCLSGTSLGKDPLESLRTDRSRSRHNPPRARVGPQVRSRPCRKRNADIVAHLRRSPRQGDLSLAPWVDSLRGEPMLYVRHRPALPMQGIATGRV